MSFSKYVTEVSWAMKETLEQFCVGLSLTHYVIVWIPEWWKHIGKKKKKDTENTSFLYLVGFKLSKLYVANACVMQHLRIQYCQKN